MVRRIVSNTKSRIKRFFKLCLISRIDWKVCRNLYRSIFKVNIDELTISSVRGYCIDNDIPMTEFEKSDIQKAVRQPRYLNQNDLEKIGETKCCPIYVAEISNAIVLENCPYIEAKKYCLDDSVEWDYSRRYCVVQGNIVSVRDNKYYVEKPIKEMYIKKGIYLCGFPINNYFHLTIDVLSRIQYVDRIEKYNHYPILLDESVFLDSRNIELIQHINVRNREIIKIKKEYLYNVEELVYAAHNTWSAINLKNKETRWNDNTISNDVISFYRNYIRKNIEKKQDLNVMIIRKSASNPRIENEMQVAEFFLNKGFLIVDTNELSFVEEVELFARAKTIVCARGAVAANFVYCSPGTTLFLFTPYKFRSETGSANIAYHSGLNYMYVDVDITVDAKTMSEARYRVSLKTCEQIWKIIEENT